MPHFTIDNVAYYHSKHYTSLQQLRNPGEMHGARRVITFCLLTAVLPTILLIIPLYLRHSVFADVTYAVAESDVLEAVDGISTVFCQEQTLKMNSTFTAFQLKSSPVLSGHRKHIQLNKSMVLPDDTLEYWGFYLLKGSTIVLSACSRFEGGRVLAVIGEKNLRTCGLKEHSKTPPATSHVPGRGQTTQIPHRTQNITPKDVVITTQPKMEDVPVQTQYVPSFVVKNNTKEEEFEGEDDDDDDDDDEENDSEGDYSKEDKDVDIKSLEQKAESIIIKHLIQSNSSGNGPELRQNNSQLSPRRVRHAKKRLEDLDHEKNSNKKVNDRIRRRKRLQDSLNRSKHVSGKHKHKQRQMKNLQKTAEAKRGLTHARQERDIAVIPGHMLDGGIGHGGNAANMSNMLHEAESSESSFEISLRSCYEGQELFTEIIPPSHLCSNIHVLNQSLMFKSYDVELDGYYYYIFYSDNDFYQNTIHAQFNIYKPTYQHTNYSRDCINQTECSFPISFLSDEIIIVEVPTKDGIEHEDADMTYLISSCYPRMSIYIIFPIAVLFLVLGCAFL